MTCAAYYGHTDVIKELIENGADVNLVRNQAQLSASHAYTVECNYFRACRLANPNGIFGKWPA